ncbi:hypothetical protein Y1Q_0009354 [Alligator mississippiensis]|uniref:Uncharacterized protein n=1 Tax=Alligator mississippiensis TaxID=8496 RepID=A0A151N7F3_ALLMI|nr:hypothetical protein Y1Q_0009354 [Alligator mississippiensis]
MRPSALVTSEELESPFPPQRFAKEGSVIAPILQTGELRHGVETQANGRGLYLRFPVSQCRALCMYHISLISSLPEQPT